MTMLDERIMPRTVAKPKRKLWKKIALISGITVAVLALIGGTTAYFLLRTEDVAVQVNYTDSGGWNRLNTPDGMDDVFTRCNPYQGGTRMYVSKGRSPIIHNDLNCDSQGQPLK